MQKIHFLKRYRVFSLLLISVIFFSCSNFLNDKFNSADNLSEGFKGKIDGIEIVYTSPDNNDVTITVESTETSVSYTATEGFSTYAWSIDGESVNGSGKSISINLEDLESGWHLIMVVAGDNVGNYHSASFYLQVKGEKTTTDAGISTEFEGSDSNNLSVSYTRENNLVTFTATEGFTSYYWTLNGTSVAGSTNTLSVDLNSLTTGIHIVTVIAKAGSGVYYSANAQISKATDITLDIKCSGITILFSSENTETFFVTSETSATTVFLTASTGFTSYSWSIDGNTLTASDNTAIVDLSEIEAGWHLVTVSAYSSNGVCYSATVQIQKSVNRGNTLVKTGAVNIGFENSDTDILSITSQTSGTIVTLTAADGFTSYSWTLDGTSIISNDNSATVDLTSVETGWHFVTVTALKNNIYYSASIYIQKTGD